MGDTGKPEAILKDINDNIVNVAENVPSTSFKFPSALFETEVSSTCLQTSTVGESNDQEGVEAGKLPIIIPQVPRVTLKPVTIIETTVFEHRGKLFRLDKSLHDWQELGAGSMKLLKHEQNPCLCRILMSNDEGGELCNHNLTSEMRIEFVNLKEVKWKGNEGSKDVPRYEVFKCHLGTEQRCKKFKQKFEEIVNRIADSKSLNRKGNKNRGQQKISPGGTSTLEPNLSTKQPGITQPLTGNISNHPTVQGIVMSAQVPSKKETPDHEWFDSVRNRGSCENCAPSSSKNGPSSSNATRDSSRPFNWKYLLCRVLLEVTIWVMVILTLILLFVCLTCHLNSILHLEHRSPPVI